MTQPMPPPASRAEPDWRTAWLVALPVLLCLLVMAVPEWESDKALLYRAFYTLLIVLWIPVLVLLQRWMWRRGWSTVASLAVLLVVTWLMALVDAGAGMLLTLWRGVDLSNWHWYQLPRGLDECWLALLAYCAAHALAARGLALQHAQERAQRARLHARDMELQALRQQIAPHFLFNALNAVSALVATDRGEDARMMLSQLGELLRVSLDTREHEVALAEELAATITYLAIEQRRLRDRLQVQWEIGADVMDAQLPFMLLQPLAENAIRHGIAPSPVTGTLQIQVARRDQQLWLCVRNTLPDAPAPTIDGMGLGQRNVAARLQQLYPQAHQFSAGTQGGGIYSVEIALPWRACQTTAEVLVA